MKHKQWIILGSLVLAFFALGAIEPFSPKKPIDMGGHPINNLAAPTSDNDAVRRSYATNASNITSGTLADARLSSNVTQLGSSIDLGSNEATGTLADARFPATLPAASGANLTALNAANLTNTVATARLGSGTASSSTYLRGDQTWASTTSYQALTDGATVTLPWVNGSTGAVTLGGNRTLAISGTPKLGERCCLRIKQDVIGGRTITWPTSGMTLKWPYGEGIILTTTAGAADVFEFLCTDETVGALVLDVIPLTLNMQ